MNLIVEDMMDVGIRELRDSLSRYLARVAMGETITVTDHGKPVARIVPAAGMSKVDQLIAEGRATPGTRPKGTLPPPIKAKGTVSEFIAEQRG
jgi:prevent-host-death family protein